MQYRLSGLSIHGLNGLCQGDELNGVGCVSFIGVWPLYLDVPQKCMDLSFSAVFTFF